MQNCNKIAPHEGRELWLVLAGIKPLALISEVKQPEQIIFLERLMFTDEISPPLVILRRRATKEVTITLRENEHLHDQYTQLIQPNAAQVYRSKADHQRAMGKLFGYTDEEIEAFINADIKCDCVNCKGMSRE